MKDTQLKELLKGKDLTKEEDFQAIFQGINDSENSLIKRKEDAFNEKVKSLQTQIDTYKTEKANYDKTSKELNDKLANVSKENEDLKHKSYVFKNINNDLDDSKYSDLIAFTKVKMSQDPKSNFEDTIKSVAETYGFVKKPETKDPEVKKPEPSVSAKSGSSLEPVENDHSVSAQRKRIDDILGYKRK